MEDWELIIIGAGVAGLTAGIYGARSGLKTLVIDEKVSGGTLAEAPLVENYPGFPSITGAELAKRITEHCKASGAQINELEKVLELDFKGRKKRVKTSKATYSASAIIIATGCHHRELGVPGEKELLGRGVSYCAVCDGAFFKGKRVLVVGGGNAAAASALYLSNLASNVKIVHRREQMRAESSLVRRLHERGVEFLWNTQVKEIKGESRVEKVLLYNKKTRRESEIEVDGVFIQVGETPNSKIAEKAGVKVNEGGYIIVDTYQRTNIEGVYAAGDVTNRPVKQIGTAIGQGIVAATEAFGYIKKPYYYKQE